MLWVFKLAGDTFHRHDPRDPRRDAAAADHAGRQDGRRDRLDARGVGSRRGRLLLAGWLILPGRGLSAANGYVVPSLANGADLRAFGGSVLYLVLIALLALGVTTAVRDSAVAIGLVLGLLYLFPIVSAVIPSHTWSRHLEQIAPMTAGLYIEATVGLAALPLTPWQGLGVLALWAVGALLLGAAVLRLRDA